MKKVFSIVLFAAGFLLLAAFLLLLGYSYGVYTTKAAAHILYSSAPYYIEAVFLSVVFLLPSVVCFVIAVVLKKVRQK